MNNPASQSLLKFLLVPLPFFNENNLICNGMQMSSIHSGQLVCPLIVF